MGRIVDFHAVSTDGLEASPYAEALAGLRANEARYFSTHYGHAFEVESADDAPEVVEWVARLLRHERDLEIQATPLEVAHFVVDGIDWTHVFYDNGVAVNVLYTLSPGGKRAVGFKLADGVPVPGELEGRFKFARQRSRLAGTIRGSFFVIRGDYDVLAAGPAEGRTPQ